MGSEMCIRDRCTHTRAISEDSLRDNLPADAPVVMYQLRKEYPSSGGNPPHVAVETISLAIERNECFGLLGPNGMFICTLCEYGLYSAQN